MLPTTRYARSGDASIAYQVTGDGPLDLLFLPGWISQIEQLWSAPAMFEDRGFHDLKGVPGHWPLFALGR